MSNSDDERDAREKAFLEAIAKNPSDEASRLVYADWLEEAGDERAEYLRLENQMWKIPPRLTELRTRIDPTWLAAVSRNVDLVLMDTPLKINAIKIVREILGIGLKEAKDIIDAMPSIIKRDMPHQEAMALRKRFEDECKGVIELRYPTIGPNFDLVLVSTPLKINAIKIVREILGLGLKEAKDLVEAMPVIVQRDLPEKDAAALQKRFENECQGVVALRRAIVMKAAAPRDGSS